MVYRRISFCYSYFVPYWIKYHDYYMVVMIMFTAQLRRTMTAIYGDYLWWLWDRMEVWIYGDNRQLILGGSWDRNAVEPCCILYIHACMKVLVFFMLGWKMLRPQVFPATTCEIPVYDQLQGGLNLSVWCNLGLKVGYPISNSNGFCSH